MSGRTRLEPSVQSTAEQQRRQLACTHVWEPYRALLWGYLEVDERCTLCGTYRAPKASTAPTCDATGDLVSPDVWQVLVKLAGERNRDRCMDEIEEPEPFI